MNRPPNFLTAIEEKELAQMIEVNVDFWQESKGLHEVTAEEMEDE